jgi:hypothetical protein
MEQLIQALTAYTSTLEQQLAALEARVAQLEAQLENCELAGKINQLEQQLIEQATLIAALTAQPAVQPTTQAEEPEIEVELVMEDEEEILDTQDGLDILEEIEDTTKPEPVVELVVEPIIEPEPVVIPVEPTPQPVVEAAPVVESASVIEKPAPRAVPTQTSLFGSAVEDIRQAISLGDRFLFQRELFAGNGELMQKTLDELNGLGSLSEAMEYVAETFDWDKESTAVQLFENVLKRRFA